MTVKWKIKVLFLISILFFLIYVYVNRGETPKDVSLADLLSLRKTMNQADSKLPTGNVEETSHLLSEEIGNEVKLSNSTRLPHFTNPVNAVSGPGLKYMTQKYVEEETTSRRKKSRHSRRKIKNSTNVARTEETYLEKNSTFQKGIDDIRYKPVQNFTELRLPAGLQNHLDERPVETNNKTSRWWINGLIPSPQSTRRWIDERIPSLASVKVANQSGFANKPYPPYLIQSHGEFMDRVRAYNLAISKIKDEIQKHRGLAEWQDVKEPNKLTVIWGSVDDFLERLSERREVVTMVLPWTEISKPWSQWDLTNDSSNVLVREYFTWTASQPLCEWIETVGFTKAHWDAVYNRTCNTDVSLTIKPRSLEWLYFHGKPINAMHYWPNDGLSYPLHFYTAPPVAIFYINIVEDAVINLSGDVISGGVKIVPYTCSHDNIPTVPIEYPERPIYRDVFVITQFWGTTYFHKMLEVMPRVAAHVEFLRQNPNVQIHAPEDHAQVSELLRVLGLNPERIVTGVTRAKVAYLPQGTPCGFPVAHEIQLLSHYYRKYIHDNLPSAPRNRLVFIRRSGFRRFLENEPIQRVLEDIAASFNLNFTLFADNPSPSLHSTMSIFNSAVVVVAPHGAGLSNVVFSEPKTLVVEGVCNPPHVNMCFQFTAHSLGHRYHGIPSEGGCEGVVSVHPETIETVLRELLKVITEEISSDKNV